jgi:hypothetical protein
VGKKHEATDMVKGRDFLWRAPTRKTETWYTIFRCPTCGVNINRNQRRSLGGVVCTGTKQTVQPYSIYDKGGSDGR